LEDAVEQTTAAIYETVDKKGNQTENFEVFLVVQRGMDIAFFEYHTDTTNLTEQGIYHFKGCVSLTTEYNNFQIITLPDDLILLYNKAERLQKSSTTREEAAQYPVPCVFHLRRHAQQIDYIFRYMAENEPRSLV